MNQPIFNNETPHTANDIIKIVATAYGLQPDDITGQRRTKTKAKARLITYKLLRECTQLSIVEIGELLNRSHSAIVRGLQAVNKQLSNTKQTESEYNQLKEYINENSNK